MKNVIALGKSHLLNLSMALSIGLLPWSEKWNTISIIFLLLGVLLHITLNKQRIKIDLKSFLIGAGIFFVALIWLPFSEDLVSGWSYVERILSALMFPLLFSILGIYYKLDLRYVFVAFLASCFIRYVYFFVTILDFEIIFILDYWKEILIQFNQFFKEEALHPSYFSLYLGFCSIICFDFIRQTISRGHKVFWTISLFAFLVMNLSLASKMPFIATVVALVFGLFFHLHKIAGGKGKKRLIAALTLGIFIFGFYLYKVPNAIKQDLENYFDYYSGKDLQNAFDYGKYGTSYSMETWNRTNRIHIWYSSISVFRANYLLGVGTGDIRNELNKQYMLEGQPYLANKDANTHNQYLDYLIKFGILGFGVIVFCFYSYINRALKTSDVTYLMFLILSLSSMITENILSRQMGIVFFFFFQSMFFFSKTREDSKGFREELNKNMA